jgi:hypothetical protein
VIYAHVIGDSRTGRRPEITYWCSYVSDAARQRLLDVESGLVDRAQVQIAPMVDQVWSMLTTDMPTGGWIFGREAAIAELDTMRNSVPILDDTGASKEDEGDNDPADTIEVVRIHRSVPLADVAYRER